MIELTNIEKSKILLSKACTDAYMQGIKPSEFALAMVWLANCDPNSVLYYANRINELPKVKS